MGGTRLGRAEVRTMAHLSRNVGRGYLGASMSRRFGEEFSTDVERLPRRGTYVLMGLFGPARRLDPLPR